jgi:tetratricopeptide (TPR) repeat protein
MAGVFLSYRRSDSAYALLLYKALTQKFGRERVFRDFENIEPGQDFVAALDRALAQCAACVVIVGKGWLDEIGRLQSDDDFVRREILAALARDTLLVPCLVGGSKLPARTAVPELLVAFLRKDAVTLGDEYFDRDTEELLKTLEGPLSRAAAGVAPTDGQGYRQLRAIELLKRQVSRLQTRAVELIQANEVARAFDELAEGSEVIMQLLEWSPGDVPLDVQLGYMYKTLAQAWDAAGQSAEANRYLDLALAMFNRIAQSGTEDVSTKDSVLNLLGNIYYQRGDAEAAIRSYRSALGLTPDYGYAWHDLLGALVLRANAGGEVDVDAMEQALARVKITGAGLPGLGAAHMAQLESVVRYWREKQSGGAREKAAAPDKPRKTTGPRRA